MKRSLKSVYLSEDAKLAQHYRDVLDMLVGNPQYADEAKRALLDKVRPDARSSAEAIVSSMKRYASAPKGPERERLAAAIVDDLQALPVREGTDRRLPRLDEARKSFSIGFMDDRSGYTGTVLTGFESVRDQRWVTDAQTESVDSPGEAVLVGVADVFSSAVTHLETLEQEALVAGHEHASNEIKQAIRKLQRLSAETDSRLRF